MLQTFTREKKAEYERGRQEGIFAVAQRMTAAGFTLDEIIQATGLEPAVIQALPPLGEENGHAPTSAR